MQQALRQLQSRPDAAAAQALLNALGERSAADVDFAQALSAWVIGLQVSHTSFGEVRNTVSGGTQGTVLQVRDVSGPITLGAPPASPPREP
ncbi:hypothetical protein ACFWJM_05570 [Streptomyces sp. NPDC127077]|uniref:hypothetical protein n=1 Tax=Streptomyces sp. NPDC127077 TaxID=3347131 RepID=UPI0036483199